MDLPSWVLFLLLKLSHFFFSGIWQIIGHRAFGFVAFGFCLRNGSFHVRGAVKFQGLFLQGICTQLMKCVQLMFTCNIFWRLQHLCHLFLLGWILLVGKFLCLIHQQLVSCILRITIIISGYSVWFQWIIMCYGPWAQYINSYFSSTWMSYFLNVNAWLTWNVQCPCYIFLLLFLCWLGFPLYL